MTTTTAPAPCAAILLAAGAARRMGERPKLLLKIDGESLLRRAARLAREAAARPIIVVAGRHAESYRSELDSWTDRAAVSLVHHLDWAEGLGGSLRRGVAALPADWPPEATFFVLAPDQPLVSTPQLAGLRKLLEARPEVTAVACAYAGTVGVPALFRYAWRERLLTASGDVGARRFLSLYRREVAALPFPDGDCDIDTEEDYAAALSRLSAPRHDATDT
ncbi:MAG: 4-diphosphocytidyl-2C-methyl-D-erythritol synthase [Chloracidobacterium sp. CP2_5A]|nr:MAG: 4-diphosphocytidyl-2C-methyl-D-erythritol synthase [Chloracidobacterium sp. CP2_5A]